MKKIILFFLVCTLFLACNDSDDNLKLSKNACTLTQNEPYAIIDIIDGAGIYTANSSDEKVAICRIDDTKVYIKAGGTIGKATITIRNIESNEASIKVTVNELVTYPVPVSHHVIVKKGTVREFYENIGIGNFSVYNENNSIATIGLNENKIAILGKDIGKTSSYLLNNMYPYSHFDIEVVDSYNLGFLHYTPDLNVGNRYSFSITGNGEYSLSLSDNSVIQAQVIPYEGPEVLSTPYPAIIQITPVKAGQTKLTVTDVDGKTASITLIIRE